MCATPEKLKTAIVDFLKRNPTEAATMTFAEFHEAIGKTYPCAKPEMAVTVSLMSLLGEIDVTKDELGRGRGFALPQEQETVQ